MTNIEKNSKLQRYIESATDEYYSKLRSMIGKDLRKLDITINGVPTSQIYKIVEENKTDENLKVKIHQLISIEITSCTIRKTDYNIEVNDFTMMNHG